MTGSAQLIVTVADVRAVREGTPNALCAPGMRAWFKQHEFDFAAFVRGGIAIETLEATGDHFALLVCAKARERVQRR